MKKDIIIGALLLILGIVIGWLCRPDHIREVTKMSTDTLIVVDTHIIEKPVLVERTSKETLLVAVHDTTIINDTIYVPIPIEKKIYKGEDYFAEISGYKASLDRIEVYPKTTTIMEIVSQPPSNWRFSADIGATVGRCGMLYIAPNLSAEIGYRRWALTGEIGCNLEVQTDALLLPRGYVELGLKYSLTKR